MAEQLPLELWDAILQRCCPAALLAMREVSRDMRALAQREALWAPRFRFPWMWCEHTWQHWDKLRLDLEARGEDMLRTVSDWPATWAAHNTMGFCFPFMKHFESADAGVRQPVIAMAVEPRFKKALVRIVSPSERRHVFEKDMVWLIRDGSRPVVRELLFIASYGNQLWMFRRLLQCTNVYLTYMQNCPLLSDNPHAVVFVREYW